MEESSKLMNDLLPKLAKHFDENGIIADQFLHSWHISLFALWLRLGTRQQTICDLRLCKCCREEVISWFMNTLVCPCSGERAQAKQRLYIKLT